LNNLPKCNWELKEYEEIELNGKIVAECDFEVEEIELVKIFPNMRFYNYVTKTIQNNTVLDKACLTYQEMEKYLGKLNYGGKNGYATHIKNLNIFYVPKKLQEYATIKRIPDEWHIGYYEKFESVERAPQNMQYVYDVNSDNPNEKKVLISIRPEWLCKILNGEKTIEVRKVVLKEMLK
jgi:predicted transcriptional regulator